MYECLKDIMKRSALDFCVGTYQVTALSKVLCDLVSTTVAILLDVVFAWSRIVTACSKESGILCCMVMGARFVVSCLALWCTPRSL